MDSRVYWIWMQQALGAGCPQTVPLLQVYGSARAVYETSEEELRAGGLPQAQCQKLGNKDVSVAVSILNATLQAGDWVLTPDDARYPSQLRGIYAMPLVLYGRGLMPALDTMPSIAVVGTRKSTAYGERMAARIATGLVAGGACVVSGGANGIDAAALRTALQCDGVTICVQGCGLDINYPADNAGMRRAVLRRGAILSEYTLGTPPLKGHFPVRNRLMSGLTNGTCVVEAPLKSGALITARYAQEQGRDVFAVPATTVMSSAAGCNQLIRQGTARLVTGASDMLAEYVRSFGVRVNVDAARAAEEQFDRPRVISRYASDDRLMVAEPAMTPPAVIPSQSKPRAESVNTAAKSGTPISCPSFVSDTAKRVYASLTTALQPVDELSARLELPTSQTLAALTELEIAGCVTGAAGGQYRIKEL